MALQVTLEHRMSEVERRQEEHKGSRGEMEDAELISLIRWQKVKGGKKLWN